MRSRLTLWALLGLVVRDAGRRAIGVANRAGRHGDRQRQSRGAGRTGHCRQHRHQRYLRSHHELRRLLQHPVRARRHLRDHDLAVGFSDLQGQRRRSRQQPGRPHERGAQGRRPDRVGQRRGQSAGAEHRQRRRLGNDRQAGDRGTAAQRAQRLESREHDSRGAGRHQQRHRVELSRRRSAGDSEQPVARRHQLLGQPSRLDQHAADCRCGRRGAGPDRQHIGRVRVVSGRRDQRRHQERHQRAARVRVQLLQGRFAQCARLVREPGESEEPAAQQSVWLRGRGAGGDPGSL